MLKLIPVAVVVTTAFLYATRANAGPLYPSESIRPGDKIAGSLKIGRRVIAVPPGDWQVISKTERNPSTDGTSNLPTMVTLVFQEIVENRLNRMLEVSATTYSARVNWINEPCKNKSDSYWIDDRKRSMNDQNCIRVGFFSGMVDNARGDVFNAWAHDIKMKGISYSVDMPYVLVTRYSSSDYLSMSVRFNPAISGIGPSKERERQFNDWKPAQIKEGSPHQQFYEALKAWSPRFDSAVERAFDGDEALSDSDYGNPKLPAKTQ